MLNWTATIWPVLAASMIKGAVVLVAAWIVTLMLRNRSAASRHIVWSACAAALLAMPLLSVSVPALRLTAAGAILPADPGLVFRFNVTAPQRAGVPAPVSTAHAVSASPSAAAP